MFSDEKVLRAMMQGPALYSEIFTEERRYSHVHLESGRIEKAEKGSDKGVGLRLITPWKTFYGSTTSLNQEDVLRLASELGRLEPGPARVETKEGTRCTAQYPFTIGTDPEGVDMAPKLAMVRSLESMVKGMEKRITQVRVIYRDTHQDVRVRNSEGANIEDSRTQVVLNLLVVGEKDGEVQTAYEAVGGFYGFDFFTAEVIENFAGTTVKRLSGLLEAREAPMGTKMVVLASNAGGTMIHEAIGHGLEADLAMEGLSCYKEMLGKRIASPIINVVDDATLPHLRGTYAFDDEGTPSERTVLVEDGILKNYLFDRFHAMKYGTKSTGNGRRESFRAKPIPRMSNTMILPGKDDPQGIISSVDDGVLVMKMGGGQVDTVRGDFVFEIAEGYLINKGRVGEMIKNATMMGNGLQVLEEIDMVGNDLGYGIGTCGKDGQGVPVSDAQPTLRIPRIVVGGMGGN
jgi:TldD protein